jgi:hypothetical protein
MKDTVHVAVHRSVYLFGERYLADITNLAIKEFVDHISLLKPATIRDYVNIVKAVVASAWDVRGEPLFMRDWTMNLLTFPRWTIRNSRPLTGTK